MNPPAHSRLGNPERCGNGGLRDARGAEQALDIHARNFSRTKDCASSKFSQGAIPKARGGMQSAFMQKTPAPDAEREQTLKNRIARQKLMMQHLREWLRAHGLTQRALADHLNVSEAAISKWKSGQDAMPAWAFLEIATLLRADPTALLAAPPAAADAGALQSLAAAVAFLTPEQVEHLAMTARLMKPPSPK